MGLTRRELLGAFLGAPFALAACRERARALPPGQLVGASDGFGHRLRDGGRVVVPADRWRSVGVVIVGAGVAGLAAAWRFRRAGFTDFAVLELERAPGGTARSGESAVSAYPWGAHYVPAPMRENRALLTLFGELGLLDGVDAAGEPRIAEQFLCRAPEERVFYKGRWYEGLYLYAGASAEDEAQRQRFEAEIGRWAAWRDARGRRAFAIPTAQGSDDPEVTALDRLTMAEWLDARGLTSPRLRWLCDYACRDDYGMTLADTSAWAGVFYWAARLPRPGAESRPIVTWPEGNGRLVRHLYGAAEQRTSLGLAAAELIPGDTGVEIAALSADGDAQGLRAQQVVFAAPQFLARHFIRWDSPPAHLAEFQYGAWMVANLTLSGRPGGRGFPLCWDNVLYQSPSLGYVVATHQRGIDRGPTVVTYYYPLCDSDPRGARTRLLGAGRDAWAEVALADLGRAHPDIRELTDRVDVMRWGHAMVRPRRGFVWGGARARAREPYRGIHFANTDLSGLALFEEAFDHGVRAAEEVLAARGIASETVR